MMLYVRNSIGTAAESGFVPAGLPSFDSVKVIGYHYDQAKALQLLKEAGYPNGEGLPQIKLLTIPQYADLGSYIANELQQIGIKVQVEAIQKSLLLEQTSKSQALFFVAAGLQIILMQKIILVCSIVKILLRQIIHGIKIRI